MTYSRILSEVETVEDADRAGLLLHPLRQRILSEAKEASTAAEIARRLDLPPQKVNYHVRTLADAGFLLCVGEGVKRNLIEKRYRASARSYVLLPQILGAMSPAAVSEADHFSATHLLRLSTLLQGEISASLETGGDPEEGLPTLSMEAELRFASKEEREAFARALQEAIGEVIAGYASAAVDREGESRLGRPYRLILGCYPMPPAGAGSAPAGTTPSPSGRP